MRRTLHLGLSLIPVGALAIALALLTAGAGPAPRPSAPPVPGPAANSRSRPPTAGSTSLTVPSGGLARAAVLHLPPGRRAHVRMPLVVARPGAGRRRGV